MEKIGSIVLESSIIIAIATALIYIMGIAYCDGFYPSSPSAPQDDNVVLSS